MADINLTELPFEVLVSIFHFVIYTCNDINEYLLLLTKGTALSGNDKSRDEQIFARRLALRLVCQCFRTVIDSPTFWAGKTVVISKQQLRYRRAPIWPFIANLGIRSIFVSLSLPRDCMWRRHLKGLSTLANLRYLSYSCNLDDSGFELLHGLSNTPLESIEIRSFDYVEGKLASFFSVLSTFSRSLQKLTIQGDEREKAASYYHYPRENVESIRALEVLCCKSSAVSKLKKELPLLQTFVFRDFYIDQNRFFGSQPFSRESFTFLKNVNRLLLEEPIFGIYDGGVKTFGTPELFSDYEDEIFKENREGTMEIKSLVLAVCDATIESYMDLFKEIVEIKHITILMSSSVGIKYASLIENWKMLETIILGACSVYRPRQFPMLREIIGTFQSLDSLTTIHFHKQEILTNNDIETISKFNGKTIKELYLDICPNIDDLCLFDIKVRFQSLLILAVCDCRGINGTFLHQNYQKLETVPKVKKIKLRLLNLSHHHFIINAIELVRTRSRNRIEIIFI